MKTFSPQSSVFRGFNCSLPVSHFRAFPIFLAFLAVLIPLCHPALGDLLNPPPNGMRKSDDRRYALTGVMLHSAAHQTRTNTTLLVSGNHISDIFDPGDSDVDSHALESRGYQVLDFSGLHVYPGLIDSYLETTVPDLNTGLPGRHWNKGVQPDRQVGLDSPLNGDLVTQMRKLGFTMAAIHPNRGLLRGNASIFSLGETPEDRSEARPTVLLKDVFQTVAFDGQGNPNSLMGEIALIRQTLYDAQWRWQFGDKGQYNALDALFNLNAQGTATPWKRFLFRLEHPLEAHSARRVINEFGLENAVYLGTGFEFMQLPILDSNRWWIVPLNFPEKPQIQGVGDFQSAELRDLMAWEQAPSNLHRLDRAGFKTVITSSGIEKGGRDKFWEHMKGAVKAGLNEDKALAMLTSLPAEMLGIQNQAGVIRKGYLANILVTDLPLFDDKSKIMEVWVEGRRHEFESNREANPQGEWSLTVEEYPDFSVVLKLDTKGKVSLDPKKGEEKLEIISSAYDSQGLSFVLLHPNLEKGGRVVFSGVLREDDADTQRWTGSAVTLSGDRLTWTAVKKIESPSEIAETTKETSIQQEEVPEIFGYPFGPYARPSIPTQKTALFFNGQIWTCGPEGILRKGAFLIHKGRLEAVGDLEGVEAALADLDGSEEPERIDLKGRHVTPGLIDCHSHTGIHGGVNEVGQAVTSEVRIGDVTDPEDINWYRQLAGGLTVANSLHGSANPIGGQNQVVKLRWGHLDPQGFHFKQAPAGIKFALGENVKRRSGRYPDTRMGVEALMRDRFLASQEYNEKWDRYRRGQSPVPPRRDLELDALLEILEDTRWIHCHSYRQDEILMLCRLAKEFDIQIGTFQHVLEGYKVAESIKEHARGASCFSDWWAYKVEVQDAIPYAGYLMHQVGVNVSFNSDDSELARRMNLEAAKAVKYGGLPEAEALKFVTLNPAIQLGIDSWVGSLEKGKHADFVIWSGHPLSTQTRALSTWIEGREYFSLKVDAEMRERIRQEKARIIEKIMTADKSKPAKDEVINNDDAKADGPVADRFTLEQQYYLNRGWSPTEHRCGWCGEQELESIQH